MDPAGGSAQLGKLIDEHGAALLHDLLPLGVDLRDLWRDVQVSRVPVTPRLVLMLAGQLPETSAFAAARRGGPQFAPWDHTNSLLATIANLLSAANHQRAGRKKRWTPIVEVPSAAARKKRVVRVADILARRKQQH